MPFLAARIQVEKYVTIRNSSARKCIVRVCSRVLIATETGLRVKPLNKYKYLINKIFVLVIYPYVTPGKIRVTRVGQETDRQLVSTVETLYGIATPTAAKESGIQLHENYAPAFSRSILLKSKLDQKSFRSRLVIHYVPITK